MPATNVIGGTFFVTTAPAATIAPAPISTPFRIITLTPIHASSQIIVGLISTLSQFFFFPKTNLVNLFFVNNDLLDVNYDQIY